MDNVSMERILKSLIGDLEYSLAYSQNGYPRIQDNYNILFHESRKEVICLNIIDVDVVDENIICELSKMVDPVISKLQQEKSSTYVYTLLVSQYGLSEAVMEKIRNQQLETISNHKTPRCFSVNTSTGEVTKLFTRRVSTRNIEGDIKTAVKNIIVNKYQNVAIFELVSIKRNEYINKYSVGSRKFLVTNTLLALNVLIFILLIGYENTSGIPYNDLLQQFGAKINYNILNGEVWRLISCMFLHANFMHIFVNAISLRNVGVSVETIYGSKKFIVIYLVSGLIGSLASFSFSSNPSVGASGAIFGLIGALLYFGVAESEKSKKLFGSSIISTIAINILYGLSTTGIDNFAHIGGLVGGFAVTGAINNLGKIENGNNKWYVNRSIYCLAVIILISSLSYVGINGNVNMELKSGMYLYELEKNEDWKNLEIEADKVLRSNIDDIYKSDAYWKVVQANIIQEDYEDAWSYIEEFEDINEEYTLYLAGIVKCNMNKFEEAKKYLNECLEIGFRTEDCEAILSDISEMGY